MKTLRGHPAEASGFIRNLLGNRAGTDFFYDNSLVEGGCVCGLVTSVVKHSEERRVNPDSKERI